MSYSLLVNSFYWSFNQLLFKVMAMFQSTFVLSVLGYERCHSIDRQSDKRFSTIYKPVDLCWPVDVFRPSKYLPKNCMVTLGSLFLTVPQLVNTKFSTAHLTNENDQIKEYRYCRVAWEEEKIPIANRYLELGDGYRAQFGFNVVTFIIIHSALK